MYAFLQTLQGLQKSASGTVVNKIMVGGYSINAPQ
jgi:hypothetical protein